MDRRTFIYEGQQQISSTAGAFHFNFLLCPKSINDANEEVEETSYTP